MQASTSSKAKDCFFIMPIGNPKTEVIWEQVYVPISDELGYNPKRVKEDDDGRSMDEQIFDFINNSTLIVADLTFARPNCYYELGYAKGIGRKEDLILCCCSDHNPDSADYHIDNHKIHFDVRQYYIVWWDGKNIDGFKDELKGKIRQRERLIEKKIIREGASPSAKELMETPGGKDLNELIAKSQKGLSKWKKQT